MPSLLRRSLSRPALGALTSALLLAGATACGSADVSQATTPSTATSPSSVPTTVAPATAPPATTPPTTIDPGTLPQTEDKPTASGTQWDADVKGLWSAIVTNDPAKATSFFFPLTAYRQVKAITNIDQDYKNRLIAYYEDDIRTLNKQLGTNAAKAQLVKLEVPTAGPQWIKPGVEYNKGAYWRVFDSKLIYTVDGQQKSLLVKSMISWRGQWYVVHLSSIR